HVRDLPRFGKLPSEVLPVIKKLPEFRRPEPIARPPSGRGTDLYCEYHKGFGHLTDQCRSLKIEIAEMLHRGIIGKDVVDGKPKERELEGDREREGKGAVLVLAGGSVGGGDSGRKRKAYASAVILGVSQPTPNMETITFSAEDAVGLSFPHNDALSIHADIDEYTVYRILIDNGAAPDVLFYDCFLKMTNLSTELKPVATPLFGFSGTPVTAEGSIRLKVTLEFSEAKARKKGGKKRHKLKWMKRPMAVPEVILELLDEELRENALRTLSNFLLGTSVSIFRRQVFLSLGERWEEDPRGYYQAGFILFHSCSTMSLLLQEVMEFLGRMTDDSLNVRAMKRLENVITLFQSVAANKETRKKFAECEIFDLCPFWFVYVSACIPNYLIPVILFKSETGVFENIQTIALSVIGILCQVPFLLRPNILDGTGRNLDYELTDLTEGQRI
ncbi:hypothetical protein Taro_031327, partial [Colocasia esculenta]|nr:hypothetical protein [Colocasia esculenta]